MYLNNTSIILTFSNIVHNEQKQQSGAAQLEQKPPHQTISELL